MIYVNDMYNSQSATIYNVLQYLFPVNFTLNIITSINCDWSASHTYICNMEHLCFLWVSHEGFRHKQAFTKDNCIGTARLGCFHIRNGFANKISAKVNYNRCNNNNLSHIITQSVLEKVLAFSSKGPAPSVSASMGLHATRTAPRVTLVQGRSVPLLSWIARLGYF